MPICDVLLSEDLNSGQIIDVATDLAERHSHRITGAPGASAITGGWR